MLTMVTTPSIWTMPATSPFCTKLETWLKIAEIPYTLDPNFNPMTAPRGKVPYVRFASGELLSDSDLIIQRLVRDRSVSLDDDLSDIQRGLAHSVQRLCEDHLYFLIAYIRWALPENWPHTRSNYFAFMPAPVRLVVGFFLRRQVLRSLDGQGTLRYTHDELLQKAQRDFQALSYLLDQHPGPFFFGSKPHTIDAIVFAFLDSFLATTFSQDFRSKAQSFQNLTTYHAHMKRTYYPSLAISMDS